MRVESILFRGLINKDLRMKYLYMFEEDGQYQTITQKDNGNITLTPSFALSITEGFGKSHIFIPSNRYYQFITLLRKTVKMISDNLYDIFPNVNKIEFEVDSRTLERFQTEQAMATGGITMIPTVWVDQTNTCYPAIRVTTSSSPAGISIPFEDGIPISELLRTFEPNQYGLSILRIIGKIN